MVVMVGSIAAIISSVAGGVWFLRGKLDYQDALLNSLRERIVRIEKKIDKL